MKPIKVWVTGRPDGKGYLANVDMDIEVPGGFLFQVRKFRLVEINEKIVLAMPNMKDSKGNWQNIFSPLNQPTRDMLEEAAINEWRRLWPNPGVRDMLDQL